MKRLVLFAAVLALLAAGVIGCGNKDESTLLFSSFISGNYYTSGNVHYDYYVNAAAGNDADSGSDDHPFKTITHAMNIAYAAFNGANASIKVAPGLYDTANGETFPMHLKNGINLVGDTANKGQPVGAANTVISNVGAANSKYTIAGGELAGPITLSLIAAPNVIASIKGFDIVTYGVDTVVFDHAIVTMESSIIQGSTDASVIIANGSEAALTNNAIYNGGMAVLVLDGATNATLRRNTFSQMGADAVWVGYTSAFPNSVDLGTAASPGNNNFSGAVDGVGLNVRTDSGAGNVVKASGNTWKANVQDADGAGQYPVGLSIAAGNAPYGAGNNFANGSGAGIQF